MCVRNGSNGIDIFLCGPRSLRIRMWIGFWPPSKRALAAWRPSASPRPCGRGRRSCPCRSPRRGRRACAACASRAPASGCAGRCSLGRSTRAIARLLLDRGARRRASMPRSCGGVRPLDGLCRCRAEPSERSVSRCFGWRRWRSLTCVISERRHRATGLLAVGRLGGTSASARSATGVGLEPPRLGASASRRSARPARRGRAPR